MARAIEAHVEPAVLKWARTSANLTPLAASRKLKVSEESLEAWEGGRARPTITQLRDAARVYRRSLAVFFLSTPQPSFETVRDYRRFDPERDPDWSLALISEERRAHTQREVLLELSDLEGESPPMEWRISPLPSDDSAIAAAARARLMRVSPSAIPGATKDDYKHLAYWTTALEEAGVLVMCTEGGQVSTKEMRAFSLYHDEVPVIVLNGTDWPRGRLFSLLHEYVHLLLGEDGVCDTTSDAGAVSVTRRSEARCNRIAAEILVPTRLLMEHEVLTRHVSGKAWTLDEILTASRRYGVSAETLFRRLVTLQLASLSEYREFRNSTPEFDRRGNASGKGNFYYTKARDLGKGFVRHVTDAHGRSTIDTYTAATYLGVKVEQIPRLAQVAQL